jgi:tRNA-splicing ligase RtcB
MEQLDGVLNWASEVDQETVEQAAKIARLPFVVGPVALMPDAHVGLGSAVGCVFLTHGAIIPSAVGVDIGCGMIAVETDLNARELPDDMGSYLPQATRDIPAGVGRGHRDPTPAAVSWLAANPPESAFSEAQQDTAARQFGSLGAGNHFYEVCLDERDTVWLVLHSGSRGIGNQLAQQHIATAQRLAQHWFIPLEDPDLAYLVQGSPEFDHYIRDMLWAQRYAAANRDAMMDAALRGFFRFVGRGAETGRINCHHNFTTQEHHRGRDLWVTRKGAIRARSGDLGVIPGSMGACSYIVRGLGNAASYTSCSHGAGRRMSRSQARKQIAPEAFRQQMRGIAWQSGDAADLVDEAPAAYKAIDQVMEDQLDLVEPLHTLHQVFNYKGVERRRR